MAFTSYLKRAIKTCDLALEAADQLFVPVEKSWRLNERMYLGGTNWNHRGVISRDVSSLYCYNQL